MPKVKDLEKMTLAVIRDCKVTDPRALQLLQYLMLPKAFRPSRQYICGKLGICDRYYYMLLRKPEINDARRQLVKQYYQDDIPDILLALKNESLAGNERAARLFLEYVDDFKKEDAKDNPFTPPDTLPKQEVNIIINNLEQKFYGNQPGTSEQPIIEAGLEV